MTRRFKRLLLLLTALLFLFSLIRIGTSTYENFIRNLPK